MNQLLNKAGLELVHHQKYTHIITLEYFFFKLDALGIFGAKFLGEKIGTTRLKDLMIPFSFGDIQLFVCKRIEERQPEASPQENDLPPSS
jgi:hypothetical protein